MWSEKTTLHSMHICLLDIDGTLLLTGGAGQTAFAQTLAADFDIPLIDTKVAFARFDRANLVLAQLPPNFV